MSSHADIAVVMVTVDRTPQRNFLGQTVRNLLRSGLRQGVLLCNSRQDDAWAKEILREINVSHAVLEDVDPEGDNALLEQGYWIIDSPVGFNRSPNRNVAQALGYGGHSGKRWVLFLEDDIDVCDDFLTGVGQWLRDFAEDGRHLIHALGANYKFAKSGAALYPIEQFYGTQGVVMRSDYACSLADWLLSHEFDMNTQGAAYDILMHHWAKTLHPEVRYFLAASPALVQHIGTESIIAPRPDIHTFPSWPGPSWRYMPYTARA